MFARMTTTTLAPGQPDEAASVLEEVMPVLRQLDGFKGMIVVSEGEGQRIVAMSLWETEQALAQGEHVMNQIRDAETRVRQVESQETASFRVVGFDIRWLSTQALGR
jgi:heme-degrading monooxygenase HmoA